MAFVNEYIPEEDIKKYDIATWDAKYLKGHCQPDWTRDRERDIYLRYICTGREKFAGRWTFCLYWQGTAMSVDLDVSGSDAQAREQRRHYKLVGIRLAPFKPMPEALLARKGEILCDLKEALIAFGDLGLFSVSKAHLSFNFDF